MKQEIAIIGLGKMGANLARNLRDNKWKVIGYNRTQSVTKELEKENINGAYSFEEIANSLSSPRIIWIMLTAGPATDDILFSKDGLVSYLSESDIVIDGGNSFYKNAAPRAKKLAKKGVNFLDVGTSGGPGGARHGACLMIGGKKAIFDSIEPLFQAVAKDHTAYQFFPGHGAGHFVKMVHNGIEYGMMQALAEGFAILKASDYNFNLQDVTSIYNNGSVIESRLTHWLTDAYKTFGEELNDISGSVKHTGEGEWTVKTARTLGVPSPIIKGSFQFRVQSNDNPSYTGKVLSALRNQFGGHAIK